MPVVGAIQGITHGFSVVVAQRFGNKEEEGVRAAVICALVLTLVFSAIFMVAGLFLICLILKIIRVPEEIYGMAKEYLRIIYGGIPITFAYHMMVSVLRAVGNSKIPLKAIAISSVCNIFMDIYFVIYMRQGIAGAAWATIIAQMMSVFAGQNVGAGDKIVACFISVGNEPDAVAAAGALAAGSVESVVQTIKIAYDFLVLLAVFFPMLYILYIARGC